MYRTSLDATTPLRSRLGKMSQFRNTTVDALQNPQQRLLDDLVFQRGDAQRTLATVGFGDPLTTRRPGTIGSPVNPIMEVRHVDLQVSLVFMPGDPVHSDGRRLLQIEEALSQARLVDVVQQGRELERAVLAGSFAHAVQTA